MVILQTSSENLSLRVFQIWKFTTFFKMILEDRKNSKTLFNELPMLFFQNVQEN